MPIHADQVGFTPTVSGNLHLDGNPGFSGHVTLLELNPPGAGTFLPAALSINTWENSRKGSLSSSGSSSWVRQPG